MRIHPAMLAADFFVATIGKLPAQSLSASLGWGIFVGHISPVYNTITSENPPQAAAEVDFDAVTPGGTTRTIARDVTKQDGFTAQYDVGLLHPGADARAICFDAAHLPIDTITQSITVIAAPAWLRASTVSGVAVAGDSISFTARYPVGPVPSSTAGATAIGDRIGALAIDSTVVELWIVYDYKLRTAVARSVMESFDLDLFGRARRGTTSRLQSLTVALDSTMNHSLSGCAGVATWPYLFDYEGISLATRAYPPIRVDVGTPASDRISTTARIARHGSTSGYLHDASGITGITSATYGIEGDPGLLVTPAVRCPLPQRDSASASSVAVTLELSAVIQSEWGEYSLRCPPERRSIVPTH